ncbi:hypothetical protein Trydic_g21456 [Trypoxylus dichotomus]
MKFPKYPIILKSQVCCLKILTPDTRRKRAQFGHRANDACIYPRDGTRSFSDVPVRSTAPGVVAELYAWLDSGWAGRAPHQLHSSLVRRGYTTNGRKCMMRCVFDQSTSRHKCDVAAARINALDVGMNALEEKFALCPGASGRLIRDAERC